MVSEMTWLVSLQHGGKGVGRMTRVGVSDCLRYVLLICLGIEMESAERSVGEKMTRWIFSCEDPPLQRATVSLRVLQWLSQCNGPMTQRHLVPSAEVPIGAWAALPPCMMEEARRSTL